MLDTPEIVHMPLLFAVLETEGFIGIGLVVFGVVTVVCLALRQRVDLRRVEQKLDALLRHNQLELPTTLSAEVRRLASDPQQKIAAIKLHREETGVSLAEAKAAVEEFMGKGGGERD